MLVAFGGEREAPVGAEPGGPRAQAIEERVEGRAELGIQFRNDRVDRVEREAEFGFGRPRGGEADGAGDHDEAWAARAAGEEDEVGLEGASKCDPSGGRRGFGSEGRGAPGFREAGRFADQARAASGGRSA